jgi:hypothetical protein
VQARSAAVAAAIVQQDDVDGAVGVWSSTALTERRKMSSALRFIQSPGSPWRPTIVPLLLGNEGRAEFVGVVGSASPGRAEKASGAAGIGLDQALRGVEFQPGAGVAHVRHVRMGIAVIADFEPLAMIRSSRPRFETPFSPITKNVPGTW